MRQTPPAYPAAAPVKYLTEATPKGLYLHIPFCAKKCAYCDFYSACVSDGMLDSYTESLIREIKNWGGVLRRPVFDTVYFGGGTPSLLGGRLAAVTDAVYSAFEITSGAEITLELNPTGDRSKTADFMKTARKSGINRLSVGAQSGSDRELELLGRTHTAADTLAAVNAAREAGFDNISLDLMLGLPGSDTGTLSESIDFILSAKPEHISAYILKIEENTYFYKMRDSISLPDDDSAANQYLYMCERLEKSGYLHYEISNFCLPGRESRHNLKYWRCGEYLGIGPSAHSFINGKRFYYPRDMKAFIKGTKPVYDGNGGDAEEYIMLRLRLAEGLDLKELESRFGINTDKIKKAVVPLEKAGFLKTGDSTIRLTDKGMTVSNSIITEILENCDENT